MSFPEGQKWYHMENISPIGGKIMSHDILSPTQGEVVSYDIASFPKTLKLCFMKSCLSPIDSEIVPPDCLRPRSFTTVRRSSLRREADESRLSVSLCDLNLQEEHLHLASTACPIPQNSLNSQQSHLLPPHLDSDIHFHQLRGAHIKTLDEQTVARSEHAREERTLVFTSRPLRTGETIFIKVTKSSPARSGSLSYGVTSCDPSVLRPSDLPYNPESLVDRKEFWAVCRVPSPLQSSDILGFLVNPEGEVILSHNGTNAGMQVCVDNSRPLWMFFGLHGAVTQLKILGKSLWINSTLANHFRLMYIKPSITLNFLSQVG